MMLLGFCQALIRVIWTWVFWVFSGMSDNRFLPPFLLPPSIVFLA